MSDKLVANELLAFLQQKLDVMDEVSAIQICKSSFSEDDISKAKKLLYGSLNKMDQMVSRRRDGTPKSLQDIITLLKETDPDDVPTFVARDLQKLPPVTFDHVDVTCLLKDIVSLKSSLAQMSLKFEASEKSVSELRKEVDSLRKSLAECRSPESNANVDTKREAYLPSVASSFESASASPSNAVSAECASRPATDLSSSPARAAPPARPAPPPAASSRPPAATTTPAAPPRVLPTFADVAASGSEAKPRRPQSKAARAVKDGEGFTMVQRSRPRRVNKNRCGTAPVDQNLQLRAELPSTAIYLSRLHYSTDVQNVTDYIRKKTNVPVQSQRVQLLESHHNASFKAFVVRLPNFMLEMVMKEDFWPEGVVFRRFRGRFPATHTTGRAPGK